MSNMGIHMGKITKSACRGLNDHVCECDLNPLAFIELFSPGVGLGHVYVCEQGEMRNGLLTARQTFGDLGPHG